MLRIKHEKTKDGNHVIDMRGRWVSENMVAEMRKIETIRSKIFDTHFTVAYFERGVINNEILVTFPKGTDEFAVERITDYINVALIAHMGSAFTPILVNPYKVGYTGDTDSLSICMEIAKETDCRFDAGAWMEPFKFHPSNNVQHNQVTDLLDTFGMLYNQ